MDTDNLIRMANQIGTFFASWPDRDEALEGIAQHLRRYWEPRMRTALYAVHAGTSAPGAGQASGLRLDPIVDEALQTHQTMVLPAPAASQATPPS